MSLPAGQRRTLYRIEHALQVSEPHLASKFAIFSRLAFPDGPTRMERIYRPRLRRRLRAGFRAVTLIPVAIGLLITGIVLSGTAHGSGVCLRTWHSMTVAPARRLEACPAQMRPGPPPPGPPPSLGMRNMRAHG